MAFVQSRLEIDGCGINLLRGGRGAPLLYLHGAGGAGPVQPFMERLAARYDVLVPEHPGFGQSDEPEWLENIHDLAYFYLDLLRRLDLAGVRIIGSSIGGWIALEMAVRDTSRIAALVLVAPSGIAVPGLQPADVFLWSPEDHARNLFFDQRLAEQRLAAMTAPEHVDVALKNRHTLARIAWEPRLHDPFLHKWLHRIDVPVQILWGEADRLLPAAYAEAFKRVLPNAEVHVIPRCGHLPQSERPDQFCDLALRFLDRG